MHLTDFLRKLAVINRKKSVNVERERNGIRLFNAYFDFSVKSIIQQMCSSKVVFGRHLILEVTNSNRKTAKLFEDFIQYSLDFPSQLCTRMQPCDSFAIHGRKIGVFFSTSLLFQKNRPISVIKMGHVMCNHCLQILCSRGSLIKPK